MTLAEYIQTVADRIGIDNADEAIKMVVTNPALMQVQVPSTLVSMTQSRLMTEDEAKINPIVKKHFTATALNSVDTKIKDVLDEFGFDDDIKQSILSEQSTYNRIPMLSKAIAEAKERAISATGGEKKTLVDKINELQGLLNTEREARKQDVDKVNSHWKSQLTDKELNAIFSGYDYALDLDKDVTISTARNLWEKKLRERGGKYLYTEDGIKLVNAEAPDLPFTIDNKSIDMRSFTDSVLAEAKLLKVNKAPGVVTTTAAPVGTPMPAKPAAPAAKSQTSKALADFKAGSSLI
jgi:hypothetical protein